MSSECDDPVDGTNWSADTRVSNVGISFSPSAVVFNDELYCFLRGTDGMLWCSVFDGTNWRNAIQVGTVGISCSPSAIVSDGLLCCFHQGEKNDGQLWFVMTGYGVTGKDTLVANVGITDSPGCVKYNDMTYCFHQGGGSNNGQLFVRSFDRIGFGRLETYESIWRNPALVKLGFDQGLAGCDDFADALCRKYKVRRAYIAFFTKFPLALFAYAEVNGMPFHITQSAYCLSFKNN